MCHANQPCEDAQSQTPQASSPLLLVSILFFSLSRLPRPPCFESRINDLGLSCTCRAQHAPLRVLALIISQEPETHHAPRQRSANVLLVATQPELSRVLEVRTGAFPCAYPFSTDPYSIFVATIHTQPSESCFAPIHIPTCNASHLSTLNHLKITVPTNP